MLIVLATVILVISFIIALISLVAEERRREALSAQAESLPESDQKAPAVDSSQAAVSKGVGEVSAEQPVSGVMAKEIKTDEGPFPWEPELKREELAASDARFPSLSGEKGTSLPKTVVPDSGPGKLLGEIKIADIGKKRED